MGIRTGIRARIGHVSLAACTVLLVVGLTYGAVARSQELITPSSLVNGGNELIVPLFKSRVLRLDAPATRVSVGNPDIADILILRATQLYVLGKDLGTTNVLLWDDADRLIGTVNIEVTHDLDNLKAKLFELLPDETIMVYSAQRSIVMAGEISSPAAMDAAIRVAETYLAQVATAVESTQFDQQSQSTRDDRAVGEVINLMQVGGVQQVMLEVTVAEMFRSELRGMNAQWNSLSHSGNWSGGGVNGGASFPDVEFESNTFTDPVTGQSFTTPSGRLPVLDGVAPWGPAIDEFAPNPMSIAQQGLFASFLSNDSLFNMALDIAKENGMAKILAEPTLTTLTGKEATFLSGGEIAIPVPQGDFRTTYEFKEFGVQVTFLPVVLGSGLINLTINVAVSNITEINQNPGALIPLILGTRRASTSVELREGQTMGLAGLIDEDLRQSVAKFPGLGEIPILGAFFRSQNFQNEETELVISVTPHLAKPVAPGDLRLPTDNFTAPGDAAWYLLGKLEGKPPVDSGNPAGTASTPPESDGAFGHQVN